MTIRYEYVGMVVHSEELFLPGGDVYRWVYEVNSELYFNLDRTAPLNRRPNKTSGQPPVGHLRASLFSNVTQVTLKNFTIEAGSTAYYAKYVVKGTNTIYARGSGGRFGSAEGGMRLPANPGYGRARWRQRVRGQQANDFITRAYNATALRHPALRRASV